MNQRKLIIAGNWKMTHNCSSARKMVESFLPKVASISTVDIVLCPSFLALQEVASLLKNSSVSLGAQNVHWEKEGAFTGEISTEMLHDINVTYVIIGHSERRQYFGETNESVNQRLHAALKSKLLPIVCVGETLEERQNNKTTDIVSRQINIGLKSVSAEEMKRTVIAYEPVWAIGTGVTATPEQAQEVHALIRWLITDKFSKAVADGVRIQYGGSVKVNNVCELMGKEDIDGALVGGASLKAEEFATLISRVS